MEARIINDGSVLDTLAPAHQQALAWFQDRAGQEIGWPEPLDGLFLLNKAKGIHKPAGWAHALSVRQCLGGPYADRNVVALPGGIWIYEYYQEGADPAARDSNFTNRALMRNLEDGVPVAVLRQVKAKRSPRYEVLGLAQVESWEAGYFRLRSWFGGSSGSDATVDQPLPGSMVDARRRIDRAIVARQGAGAFRAAALAAFSGRCAISGYDVAEGLEAAHIVPYLGPHTNDVTNALLLRADLHTLFDRGILTVDPTTLRVALAPSLKASTIKEFDGVVLNMPTGADLWKSSLELRMRRDL